MEKTGNKEKIKESENGKILIKGLVIGSTMTLPGVSGGSMAMVLGIYDRLLKHVSEITKYPKESLTFLLWFAAGAGSGAFLFSRGISWLLTTRAEGVLRFFFLGAVAGGIPMILKSASVRRIKGRELICILTGILTALLIALIPQGVFAPEAENAPLNMLFQFAGGFIIAVALVLPDVIYAGNLRKHIKSSWQTGNIYAFSLSCWRDSWNISHSPYSGTADPKAQRSHIFNNIRLYAGIIAVTAARTFNRRKPAGRWRSVGAGFCKSLFFVSKVSD